MPDPTIWPIVSVTETEVAVGLASTEVLVANAERGDADFVNNGDNVIFLARGNAAVWGRGQRLNPNGGSYHIGTNNLFTGIVYAISDNETNLSISEGVIS